MKEREKGSRDEERVCGGKDMGRGGGDGNERRRPMEEEEGMRGREGRLNERKGEGV